MHCPKDRWQEGRCTICMEHPHNAVLLICSSHERGCRPYMCRTSRRLSNCLDRFYKLNSVRPSKSTGNDQQPNKFVRCGGKVPDEPDDQLLCPLCRGQINGWIVVESARRFLDSLVRSCPPETCDISGNYVQLRKQARLEHPMLARSVLLWYRTRNGCRKWNGVFDRNELNRIVDSM